MFNASTTFTHFNSLLSCFQPSNLSLPVLQKLKYLFLHDFKMQSAMYGTQTNLSPCEHVRKGAGTPYEG